MEATAGQGERPTPPPLPLGVRLQLAGLTAAIDAVERSDGTVNRCLYSVIARLLSARANPRPDGSGVRSYDFTVDASRGIWARVFAPVSSEVPLPVIVYYHGGGFALFSPAIGPFNGVCRRLCSDVGAVVVSVNYRLAPFFFFTEATMVLLITNTEETQGSQSIVIIQSGDRKHHQSA